MDAAIFRDRPKFPFKFRIKQINFCSLGTHQKTRSTIPKIYGFIFHSQQTFFCFIDFQSERLNKADDEYDEELVALNDEFELERYRKFLKKHTRTIVKIDGNW